jgi:two-component system LytT family response regulator
MTKLNKKLKAVILDDEMRSNEMLLHICRTYFATSIDVVGVFNTPRRSVRESAEHDIDIVFIDVSMQGFDGFEFMTSQPFGPKAKFIIICKDGKHMLKAIKSEAFDYISKPIRLKDIRACLKRLIGLHLMKLQSQEDAMRDNLLIINRHDRALFLDIDEILRFEANGSYTDIFLEKGQKISSTKNILFYHTMLQQSRFYKVHRSHLINLNKVKELIKYDGEGVIVMSDNSKIVISKTKKNEFLRTLTKGY